MTEEDCANFSVPAEASCKPTNEYALYMIGRMGIGDNEFASKGSTSKSLF